MSINTSLSSVSSSSSTSQVSKSSGSESTKKTSESSFKDEMDKVTTSEKESTKENTAEVTQKEVKEETSVTKQEDTANKPTSDQKVEVADDKKPATETKDQSVQASKDNVNANTLSKEAELKNLELLKNQQLLDRNNLQAAGDRQQPEILESQQVLMQQGLLAEKELSMKNILDKNKAQEITPQKVKHHDNDETADLEIDAAQNLAMLQQQNVVIDNNYNVDTHKTEENELLSGNIIFNNTLTNFDVNNNELSNDIQQMINTTAIKVGAAISTQSVGSMKLNSSNKVSMTQSDAEFFVNLTQNNNEVTVQNITAQAAEMTQKGADVKEVEKNVQVSQALLDALHEARENNQPLRIDFDQNISVVLRVNKDGVLAANFIPHDKAVEQYLRNNIETLKNTFNENDLPYSDLSYSNRGSKQQKEQQRNRQQQQQ